MLALALGLSLLTTLANIVGSLLAAFSVKPGLATAPRLRGLLGFAGGFILAGALGEVLPEAIEEAPLWGPILGLGGYFLLYGVEQFFAGHAHAHIPGEGNEHTLVREVERTHPPISPWAAVVALVGFNLHDFIDGLGIGAGFVQGSSLGFFMLLTVLVHELPAGASVAALMLGSGRGRLAAVLAGTSIGLVTLVAVPLPFWAHGISERLPGGFMGLAGGSFLYIAVHSLIPACVRGGGRWGFLMVPLGSAVALVSGRLLGV
ncbi:MAG: ZIP family metal transporter [Dehalococcoidia bacterium]